jgi:multiple antibiotic resistance protein
MTASVSFPAKYGMPVTLASIVVSILINMFIMMAAPRISSVLMRHNIAGALIRITGLIVATIGIQMALDGVREFVVSIYGIPAP